MRSLLKKMLFISTLTVLSACTCATPVVVTEIQKSDKKLTCKDIILEINEAEHFKEMAKKEEGIGFGNALMPVCWISSFVDASKAVNSANARIAYLGNIYDVLDCGGRSDEPAVGPQTMAPVRIPAQQYPSLQSQQPVALNEPMEKGEVDDEMVRNNMHSHVDKHGKSYTHSHYHAGPHRHGDDQ